MRLPALALGFILAFALPAPGQEADIRATIDQQLQRFKADDFPGAFQFASPPLQRLFQTPENFRRMVTTGYPMVWRYGEFRFLELREEAGTYWQKLQITDDAGRTHVLEYRMIETPEGWRIHGVQILDQSDLSA